MVDTIVIQWKDPTPEQSWLSRLEVAPNSKNLALQTARLDRRDPDYPNGVCLTLAKEGGAAGWIQVRLAQGYGFLISDQMLDRHPYLWVRDMGIYISRVGTWTETAGTRERNAGTIGDCLKKPFVSCAEKYFQWTCIVEHERGLDQKIWDIVKEKQEWPLDVGAVDHITAAPEVDAAHFTERFPDLKHSRVYLGWPDHDDEFILWNKGKVDSYIPEPERRTPQMASERKEVSDEAEKAAKRSGSVFHCCGFRGGGRLQPRAGDGSAG